MVFWLFAYFQKCFALIIFKFTQMVTTEEMIPTFYTNRWCVTGVRWGWRGQVSHDLRKISHKFLSSRKWAACNLRNRWMGFRCAAASDLDSALHTCKQRSWEKTERKTGAGEEGRRVKSNTTAFLRPLCCLSLICSVLTHMFNLETSKLVNLLPKLDDPHTCWWSDHPGIWTSSPWFLLYSYILQKQQRCVFLILFQTFFMEAIL